MTTEMTTMTENRISSNTYSGTILFKDGRKKYERHLKTRAIELLAVRAEVAEATVRGGVFLIHNDDGTSFFCYRNLRLRVRLDARSLSNALRAERKTRQMEDSFIVKSVPRASGRARISRKNLIRKQVEK